MSKSEFIQELDERTQEALYDAAVNYINPDFGAMQVLYEVVLEALSRLEDPKFSDDETAAYIFQALFEAKLIKEWLIWLGSLLKEKTNGDITLSEISPEEERGLSGGYIKGPHEARLLSRKRDQTNKLVIFGPYKVPVEIISQTGITPASGGLTHVLSL
ncbi:hypothetical protein HYU90_02060 [Candidatus Collierbacteria bacterium]|nr:hypothetical protein [Candidatus Collierbacteria bacterium]